MFAEIVTYVLAWVLMNEFESQSNLAVVENLFNLAETLSQKLPTVNGSWPQLDISLSAEQFDSLVASW